MKCALVQNYMIESVQELTEDQVIEFSLRYQNVIDITGVTPAPTAGWRFDGRLFVPPAPMSAQDYVAQVVIPSASEFALTLEKNFIRDNILMGITQLGKTSGVLGVMTKGVVVAGSSEPVSLMDTLHAVCPSLTVTIQIIDYHLAHIEDYASLSPFITTARLTAIKNSIKAYLGIP